MGTTLSVLVLSSFTSVLGNRKRWFTNVSSIDDTVVNVGSYWKNGVNKDKYGIVTDVRPLLIRRDKRIVYNNRTATECFSKWTNGGFFINSQGTDNEAYYGIRCSL